MSLKQAILIFQSKIFFIIFIAVLTLSELSLLGCCNLNTQPLGSRRIIAAPNLPKAHEYHSECHAIDVSQEKKISYY